MKLTSISVKTAPPGTHADSATPCLYLVVGPDRRSRSWIVRLVVHGKRRELGLGSAGTVTLAEARERARAARKLAREGVDPLAARQSFKPVPTFLEAAKAVHEAHSPSWRNEKHATQWLATLKSYAFPKIGDKRVADITEADVLGVLGPIWLTKPETARRVRQRIGAVLDWAKASGWRSGENPVQGLRRVLPRQPTQDAHHAALPYAEVFSFVHALREGTATPAVKLALEFLILTAARVGEVIGATWAEVGGALWTVPAERMKANREHVVPLSDRAREILAEARQLGDGEYVFPSPAAKGPLSDMALLMAVRRIRPGYTAHGFRSSFRDWAAECTQYPREVCEAALAHTVESKVEAAYRRTTLLDKRRELMAAWARYVERQPAEVLAFPGRAEHA